jgi:hypothetical protein
MAVTWSKADIRVMLCAGGLRAWAADDDAAEASRQGRLPISHNYTDTPVAPSLSSLVTWTFNIFEYA